MALKTFDYNKETAVNIVKTILTDAIKHKATDIHLDPVKDGLLIKMRIDGELTDYTKAPDSMKKNIITRVKIISGMNITESELPQKGIINHEQDNNSYNMRVSSLPLLNGEKIVIHLSDYTKSLEGIDNLGINETDLTKIKSLMKNSSGIILITGQILSGKTTTLYSMLKELKDDTKNIMTIENPIKMKIDGINQAQVNIDKNLTIPVLLENTLLQDPNIIGLSEISDDETARLVVRSALNGKLLISTMHTKNIYTTLENLENRDIENYLLATSLSGIISQRLVKRLCPYCKAERPATDYEKNIFKKALNIDIENIIDAVGCRECQDGYTGRIPLTEVLVIDDKIKNAINKKITKEPLRNMVYQNITNIIEDGLNKVLLEETSLNEVIKVADISNDFGYYNDALKKAILGEIEVPIDNVPYEEETPVEEVNEVTENEPTEEIIENTEIQTEESVEGQPIEETTVEENTEVTEENIEEVVEEQPTEEIVAEETVNEENIVNTNEETNTKETINEETTTPNEETQVEQSTEEQAPTEEIVEEQQVVEENSQVEATTPVEEVQQEQPVVEETTPVEEIQQEQPVVEEIEEQPTEITEEDYDNMDYGDYQAI